MPIGQGFVSLNVVLPRIVLKPPKPVIDPPDGVVQCYTCGDIHPYVRRKKHNGSHSCCPKCGDDVHVLP